MSRKSPNYGGPDAGGAPAAKHPSNRQRFALIVALVILVNLVFGLKAWRRHRDGSVLVAPVTFTKDVAPILYRNCSGCHRPGQSAPFALLTYGDAKRHAQEIAEVTARRYMPPWAPEPGHGEFADERRLSEAELATIQRWGLEGAVEGNPRDLPSEPKWTGDWQLGPPDLVVQAPAYELRAEGRDIYHNFVVPIPVAGRRFVKGVELLPGNARVAHHAFIKVDATSQSRRLAAKQSPPGFDGMENPESAVMPGGQLLSWQPGKTPSFAAPGLPWVLQTNTDLVLQMHMNPSGKPETVQPSVGFYFTDVPPTNSPFRLRLTTLKLDIPAGESNYVAEESYLLPVDTTFIRVGAHAHYLGKDLSGYAILPGGEKQWLLRIKDWDFKWQGDYRYATPVKLPKGTRVVMRFTYDNSPGNPRNPNSPPKRVLHGLQTTDEMGELYFQVLPDRPQDYAVLARDFSGYFLGVSRDFFALRVERDPNDAEAHKRLGRILGSDGKLAEAIEHLTRSIAISPNDSEAHFDLGLVYMRLGKAAEAFAEFRTTVLLNPDDSAAFGSLGILASQAGRQDEARRYLERALEINPQDELARKNLERISGRGR